MKERIPNHLLKIKMRKIEQSDDSLDTTRNSRIAEISYTIRESGLIASLSN